MKARDEMELTVSYMSLYATYEVASRIARVSSLCLGKSNQGQCRLLPF